MNATYTVRLKDNTVGTIAADTINGQHADAYIGEIVRIKLRNENGGPIEVDGELVEVLEVSDY